MTDEKPYIVSVRPGDPESNVIRWSPGITLSMVVSLEKHGGQSDYSVAGEEATWLIDHGESTYVEQGWIYDARKNDFAPRLAGAYLQFKKLDNAVLFKLIFG